MWTLPHSYSKTLTWAVLDLRNQSNRNCGALLHAILSSSYTFSLSNPSLCSMQIWRTKEVQIYRQFVCRYNGCNDFTLFWVTSVCESLNCTTLGQETMMASWLGTFWIAKYTRYWWTVNGPASALCLHLNSLTVLWKMSITMAEFILEGNSPMPKFLLGDDLSIWVDLTV